MPTKELGQLNDAGNNAIADYIWGQASYDYQRRVPLASKVGAARVMEALDEYTPMWNEFIAGFINRIGRVIGRNLSWSNPLAEFKKGVLSFGDTVEEYAVGLLNAHVYDPKKEYLADAIFGTEVPYTEANFHRINRQEFYRVTVNDAVIKRAFINGDDVGGVVTQLMTAPLTSDNWDEFTQTMKLFGNYEANGGFYKVNIPDVAAATSKAEDARSALRKIRGVTETIKFLSTKYNAAHMPSFAKSEELVLFTTPEFRAAVDVEALAVLFNMDKADIPTRIVSIPKEYFGIDGCQAILTVTDFFVILDTVLENRTSSNPAGLSNNFFWHHHSIISASRFVPAVMFTTKPGTDAVVITPPKVTAISAIKATDKDGNVPTAFERGHNYLVACTLTTDPATPKPSADDWKLAVKLGIEGAKSNKTNISDDGVLTIGSDEAAAELTIKGTTLIEGVTKTLKITVSGDVVPDWPAS